MKWGYCSKHKTDYYAYCALCHIEDRHQASMSQGPIHRCEKHHKDYVGAACPECVTELTDAPDLAPAGKKPSQLGDCLDEAKKTICGERQDVYGSPEDSFTLIANYWNSYLAAKDGMLSALDIAHMMVLFKMARVQGQAPKRDNYVDLCGYAAIAADRLSARDSQMKEEIKVDWKDCSASFVFTWKDGSPGCPHTRTKFVKTPAADYRQCLGCGARLEEG